MKLAGWKSFLVPARNVKMVRVSLTPVTVPSSNVCADQTAVLEMAPGVTLDEIRAKTTAKFLPPR